MTLEQFASLKQLEPYYRAGRLGSGFIASHLGVSDRHARRLMSTQCAPRCRRACNRFSDEIVHFITEEKQANPRYNCQWLSEIATDRFSRPISRTSVYRILKEKGLLETREIARKPRSRFEAERSGDLVQMDTTWGYWLNGHKLCLIVLLDDYSRYILKARFCFSDGLVSNLQMIRETVEQYGVFRLLYTDNASWFKVIRHNKSMYETHSKEEYESQITRACRETGITHITHKPYQPQGKGKIERLFHFMQERLIDGGFLIDANDPLEAVNRKLNGWVSWYNTKHINRTTGVAPKERFDPNGFTPLNGNCCLDDIFCLKDTRKVDKCNQFSYQGAVYTIPSDKCMVAYTVKLHVVPGGSIRVWHNDQLIYELPLKERILY